MKLKLIMSEEVESHIYKKFEILQKLGKGAYGIVWKAIEKKTKKIVALKKVFEAFHNETDAQRTFREVMILQELANHENVIKLINVIKAENNKDLYLVFEFMETDLHSVIKAGILKKVHKQYIIYQLLKGLKYIHSGEIIHRDLKPSNLLINSECLVKIGDFGLARSVAQFDEEDDPIMTEYVATRWYRAPEIVLGSNKYSKKVDVWSVGCILAELINEKALFPGKSTLNQIELILEVIGKPSSEDVKAINSQNAASIISSISIKNKRSFASFFKDTNPVTLDFLQRCLQFNPEKRMSIDEALAHPFVSSFRDEKEETVVLKPVQIQIDDNRKLSIKEYREALYNDIVQKKKEQRKIWRQKYLQQLGIDLKNDIVKKDLFKNLMAKKRDPLRPDSAVKEKSKSPIPNAPFVTAGVKTTDPLGTQKQVLTAQKYTGNNVNDHGVISPMQNFNSTNPQVNTRDEILPNNVPSRSQVNPVENEKPKQSLANEKSPTFMKKESNIGSHKHLSSSKDAFSSNSLQNKPKFASKERRSTGITSSGINPLQNNYVSQFNPRPANYQKLTSYYRDVLTNPFKNKF